MDLMQKDGILYKRYNLKNIFLDAMYGCLESTQELDDYLYQEYKITSKSTFGLLSVWLGELFESHKSIVREGLQALQIPVIDIQCQCVELLSYQMLVLVIYPLSEDSLYPHYQRCVQNELRLFTPEKSISLGERCKGLANFNKTLALMNHNLEWNLVFGKGILINSKQIEKLRIVPMKYPKDLDGEVEKSIIQNNSFQYEKCFGKLWTYCRQEVHAPKEVKGVCLQYCANIKRLAKHIAKKEDEIQYFELLNVVGSAHYWREIWEALLNYTTIMYGEINEEVHYSLLVSQAKMQIIEYYNEGITLEEIAERLHVSEEHLSQLFKKETGLTFSETIRGFRIQRVKKLLESSQLKMSEIAKLTGYSDPKYMSKVFKEVVGMSPNEYRKVRIK
ncbi:MAG: AraC family transcriptional regulator [Eubacteriales bacterium]